MARRASVRFNHWTHDTDGRNDHIGRRPPLASAGGPAGRPTGKHRVTKPKRKKRR